MLPPPPLVAYWGIASATSFNAVLRDLIEHSPDTPGYCSTPKPSAHVLVI